MFGSNRRLRALVYLVLLFPLWWLQRTQANPLSGHSAGGHSHGHSAKSAPSEGDSHHGNHDGGGDGDDGGSDGDDGDDGGGGGDGDDGGGDGDDGGHDGDDDDGDDGDDGDDDDGGHIRDCNQNGIDDSIDIANGTSQDVNGDGIPDECQSFAAPYCNGTGASEGGVDCPCGNVSRPAPIGCANSTGSGASLTASGIAFVSHDTLVLTVTNIPVDHTGVFYAGEFRVPGLTYGDGIRCITAPLVRVSKVSHATGHDSIPPPGSPPLSVQLGITPGQTIGFQVFYRDASGPCHMGFNTSNAILVHWGP